LGRIVVVVGGRRVTVIVTGSGEEGFPLSPQSGLPPLSSGEESLSTVGKGTVMLPPDVELLVIPP